MSQIYLSKGENPLDHFQASVDFILKTQCSDGSIPWFTGGHLDPWDHAEAAMGLSIAGRYDEAVAAYKWSADNQLESGSWWAKYVDGQPVMDDESRYETNFIAYIATGVWHHYLITENRSFLEQMWPCVESAIDYVLSHQADSGTITWAIDHAGIPKADALVTGCSSIYKSIECAINIAFVLQQHKPEWISGRAALGNAMRHHPERFDQSKSRYSMDWFYPILTGVYQGQRAQDHIHQHWDTFVKDGMGCLCVSDEPWVTIAESCELTMALIAAGKHESATELFSWLHQYRCDDGVHWTGYQYHLDLLWPNEQPTWTAGAVLLAADALCDATPASKIFTEVNLLG